MRPPAVTGIVRSRARFVALLLIVIAGFPAVFVSVFFGGSMIIEAAAMIREGASSQDVERRLLAMAGDTPAPASFAQAA